MSKILKIYSCERIPKDGDRVICLIEYSIEKYINQTTLMGLRNKTLIIRVGISRSLLRELEISGLIKNDDDIDREIRKYARFILKHSVTNFKPIEPNQEFILTSYDDYSPESENDIEINPIYSEIIEVKGKLGFLEL